MRMSTAAIFLTLATAGLVSGHAQAGDSTAGRTATMNEQRETPPNVITPKRHEPTLTPKRGTTPAAAAGTSYSKQPKALTHAHVSCIESCRAACAGPKRSKSACGPAYDSCVAEC